MRNIKSTDNQTIKDLIKRRKGGVSKKAGKFLIDGRREIEIALREKVEIEEIFYCPELARLNKESILFKNTKNTQISEGVFQKIAYKENPDGFIALAKRSEKKLEDVRLSTCPLVIILEAVEKPGNLGAIIRTAYAAGVDVIILNDQQTDLFNPNIIRASEGLVFSLPLVVCPINKTIDWLKDYKIKTRAAVTGAKKYYYKTNLTGPTALIFGSEAQGLSESWLSATEEKIAIPMKAGIDSLNVSVAAGILMFEIIRQRAAK